MYTLLNKKSNKLLLLLTIFACSVSCHCSSLNKKAGNDTKSREERIITEGYINAHFKGKMSRDLASNLAQEVLKYKVVDEWETLEMGLNIKTKCLNPECPLHREKYITIPKHFGRINWGRDLHKCLCPSCGKRIKYSSHTGCMFRGCEYNMFLVSLDGELLEEEGSVDEGNSVDLSYLFSKKPFACIEIVTEGIKQDEILSNQPLNEGNKVEPDEIVSNQPLNEESEVEQKKGIFLAILVVGITGFLVASIALKKGD